MQEVQGTVSVAELKPMAERMFGNLVKAVVDIRLNRVIVDAELLADEETFLLETGSKQDDLWGINLYPELDPLDDGFIEFDSMINLRPSQGNTSSGVDDAGIRQTITEIIRKAVVP